MDEVIDHRPKTIMEVFKSLPEGTLAEVIDNALYMSPAPTPRHQKIRLNLATQLNNVALETGIGEVYDSPIDLYLDEISNAAQPDVLFFFKDNPVVVSEIGLHGSPNFIIEILSPGNLKHDRVVKKELYERFGVNEYWIVDPKTNRAVGYLRQDHSFISLGEFSGHIRSPLFNQHFNF